MLKSAECNRKSRKRGASQYEATKLFFQQSLGVDATAAAFSPITGRKTARAARDIAKKNRLEGHSIVPVE